MIDKRNIDLTEEELISKIIELKNPITDECKTCGQKLPGIIKSTVKIFLNE